MAPLLDVSLYARVPRALRDQLNEVARDKGMGSAQLLRVLVMDAIERHTGRTLCAECCEALEIGADGTPRWHSHGGRIIGPREDS